MCSGDILSCIKESPVACGGLKREVYLRINHWCVNDGVAYEGNYYCNLKGQREVYVILMVLLTDQLNIPLQYLYPICPYK